MRQWGLWLVAVLGCGGGGGSLAPDARPDVQVDGSLVVDAPPAGPMARVVLDIPQAGVNVVFHRADGSILDARTTDAEGVAVGPMEADGMITIGEQWPVALYTIVGVQPGDEIRFERGGTDSEIGTINVTMPGAFPGATSYQVDGVGSTNPNAVVAVPVRSNAAGNDGDVPVLALAGDGGSTLAFSYQKDVPAGSSVVLPAWQSEFADVVVSLAGFTDALTGTIALDYLADGMRFHGGTAQLDLETTGGSGELTVAVPAGFPDEQRIDVAITELTNPVPRGRRIVRRVEASGSYAVSPTEFLPHVGDVGLGWQVAARPDVSWTTTGDLSSSDLAIVQLVYGAALSRWWVFAPGSTASPFRFPELPESLSIYRPQENTVPFYAHMTFVDADYFDWSEFRHNGLPFGLEQDQRYDVPAGSHTLRITGYPLP